MLSEMFWECISQIYCETNYGHLMVILSEYFSWYTWPHPFVCLCTFILQKHSGGSEMRLAMISEVFRWTLDTIHRSSELSMEILKSIRKH